MTTRASAAADIGLPISPSIFDPLPRRGFLRGLAKLPLIGGGVKLLGQPTGVAEPVTFDMLPAYKTWLHFEHRNLAWEMADHPRMVAHYGGDTSERYHQIEPMKLFVNVGDAHRYHRRAAPPSERAALVMSAVGCDCGSGRSGNDRGQDAGRTRIRRPQLAFASTRSRTTRWSRRSASAISCCWRRSIDGRARATT